MTLARPRLTNLAHLDFLTVRVAPPAQARHTTHGLAEQPEVGALWTYAEPGAGGAYRRLGGGTYDPVTGRYGQGAFNADDVSRAAIVYLRHWRANGDQHSREQARQLLRGLTYLQTAEGPDAGNVVLWMQPDGTLNRSAVPMEHPDPSDSGPSHWLARTVWALGEGYAAFRRADAAFAAFLLARLDLALGSVQRQVLSAYGATRVVDGLRWPAWLIADGADASAEALYGLVAIVEAGTGPHARLAAEQLAEGIAALQIGDAETWPFGAILPWARSRSVWHAWGGQMAGALARAGRALGRREWVAAAVREAGSFTPYLLAHGGPDDGWLPAPVERTQLAYGADAMLQNLLATAASARAPAFRDLAAIAAAWYFGNNHAGVPVYDPGTGRTADGVAPDGTVNVNAGAESTIHGLLSMLALDRLPDLAVRARVAVRAARALQAEVEWLVLAGEGHGQALLRSFGTAWERRTVPLPGGGPAVARAYDGGGRLLRVAIGDGAVPVAPAGFTMVSRW